jgi:hypothetical protein
VVFAGRWGEKVLHQPTDPDHLASVGRKNRPCAQTSEASRSILPRSAKFASVKTAGKRPPEGSMRRASVVSSSIVWLTPRLLRLLIEVTVVFLVTFDQKRLGKVAAMRRGILW